MLQGTWRVCASRMHRTSTGLSCPHGRNTISSELESAILTTGLDHRGRLIHTVTKHQEDVHPCNNKSSGDGLYPIPRLTTASQTSDSRRFLRGSLDSNRVGPWHFANSVIRCLHSTCAYSTSSGVDNKTITEMCEQLVAEGIERRDVAHATIIAQNIKCGETPDVAQFKDTMVEMGVQPSAHAYNLVIGAYADRGDYTEVLRWLGTMVEEDVFPDAATYVSIIKVWAQNRNTKTAQKWFTAMVENGVTPSAEAYVILMKAYGRQGEDGYDKVLALFDDMETNGIEIDIESINAGLSACARCMGTTCTVDAAEWYKKIQARGLTPNLKTYNAMINYWGRAGNLGTAAEWLEKMQTNACILPDVVSYNTLVHAHASQGDIDGALQWVVEMDKQGIHPDGATYTPILIALGKSLPVDLEKVLHTADAMLQAGIALNHYSLPAILRCCARAKASDVAVAVFESNCHTVYVWNDHVQRALKEAVGAERAATLTAWASKTHPACNVKPATAGAWKSSANDAPFFGV